MREAFILLLILWAGVVMPRVTDTELALARVVSDPFAFFCRYFPEWRTDGDTVVDNAPYQLEDMRDFGTAAMARSRTGSPGKGRIARARPREHAKTTLAKACKLWAILCGWRRYCVTIREKEKIAASELKEYMRILEDPTNLLVKEFGLESWAKTVRRSSYSWTSEKLHIPDIAGRICVIEAASRGQSLRGLNDDGLRPDLIWGDDLERLDEQDNRSNRDWWKTWFWRDVMRLGKNALVVIEGTIVHYDSLLMSLKDTPGWQFSTLQAITRAGTPLWPDRYPIEDLEAMKAETPASAWLAEMMNEPMSSESSIFPYESWRYYEDEGTSPPALRDLVMITMGVDTALSAKERADFTAIVVIGLDRDGCYHILHEQQARISSTAAIVAEIERVYNSSAAVSVVIEDERGAAAVIEGLILKGIPVTPIAPAGRDKEARARTVNGHWELGKVWVSKRRQSYLEELFLLGTGPHDDRADATVYAMLGITQNVGRGRLIWA